MIFELNGLPGRTQKKRENGITLVLDKGYSLRQCEDFLESSEAYTDIIKLGWGTSYVCPNLPEKLDIYRNANIPVYFGGTLFEAYLLRDQLDDYLRYMDHYKIGYVEVSNGTIRLSQKKKLDIITELQKNFTVLSEVGSKDPTDIMAPYQWVEMISSELEAGAWKVICEARESGTVGMFRPNGEIRSGLIDEITHHIPTDKLLFEAPNKEQQVWFLKKFGTNVNLGNITPQDVITLETLRLGLRGDTLFDFYVSDGESLDMTPDNIKRPKD
ncbi:MAG: phosphosulfolactate synthase [Balneolales bacterium]